MNINEIKKQLSLIKDFKSKKKDIDQLNLKELQKLPHVNGIIELKFKKFIFFMLNIFNDDAVALKYFWRDKYEKTSLNIWYKITRENGFFFDVGAHTGIYSIIGNLDKSENHIISIEPFYLNLSRLISNLRLNNFTTTNCLLGALSDSEGLSKLSVKTVLSYHSSGGQVSEKGNLNITKYKLDNFKLNKKVCGIKIDTEGHEFKVMQGGIQLIKKNLPDIIFEINESNFNDCVKLLKEFKYNLYFIDEVKKNLLPIQEFDSDLKRSEGINCFATCKVLKKNFLNTL